MPTLVKLLLLPFSFLYGSITDFRNWLYNSGLLKSYQPPVAAISVGNLTVGGTGKTPCVEYLIRLLSDSRHITVLSRGYGRKTKGYVVADRSVSAQDIGDEPLQYFQKYGDKINVVVCENRVEGFHRLHQEFHTTDLLLLDDAYQHRPIQPFTNLLLNDYSRPFYKDYPFPAGRLRESRSGARRADAVIVTKCPLGISKRERDEIEADIHRYSSADIPVFFAGIAYGKPYSFGGIQVSKPGEIIAVAGIARPEPFLNFLQQISTVEKTLLYKDHHDYSRDDIAEMIKYLKKDNFVVTTEKDRVKLSPLIESTPWKDHFLYVPIQMEFIGDSGKFDQWITQRLFPNNEQKSSDV